MGFFPRRARGFFAAGFVALGFRLTAFLPPALTWLPGAGAEAVIAVTSLPFGEGELGVSKTTDAEVVTDADSSTAAVVTTEADET